MPGRCEIAMLAATGPGTVSNDIFPTIWRGTIASKIEEQHRWTD